MKKIIILLFIFILFSVNKALASIAYVNNASTFVNSSSVATMTTGVLSITGGNIIVISIGYLTSGSVVVSSVTDTSKNTYYQCSGCAVNSGGSSLFAATDLWYAINVKNNTTNNVTVNFGSGTAEYPTATQLQYSGVAAFSPFQVGTHGVSVNGTSITSSSFNPSYSNGLNVVAYIISGGATATVGSGYFNRIAGNAEDRINAPSGSQTASISWTGNTNAALSVASFRVNPGSTINDAKINNAKIN